MAKASTREQVVSPGGQTKPAVVAQSTGPAPRRPRFSWNYRDRKDFGTFLLFAMPNILLIIAFTYRPLLTNMYYSTLNWTLGSLTATPVGLANYKEFFSAPDTPSIFATTAIFTVATVGGSMILGLLIALALNKKVRGVTAARATIFAPYVLSGVGVGLLWTFIFDPTVGVMGTLLRSIGLSSPQWFNNPHLSLLMIIIVYVWKNLGYAAVIYVAAMQAIPQPVLEAAAIDGAGGFQAFRRIVLPLLSPTTFFLLITTILNSLQAFDLIKTMTPLGEGTTTLMYETYLQAFGTYNRAGYSAAISVVLFAILLIITVVQLRLVERKVHY